MRSFFMEAYGTEVWGILDRRIEFSIMLALRADQMQIPIISNVSELVVLVIYDTAYRHLYIYCTPYIPATSIYMYI